MGKEKTLPELDLQAILHDAVYNRDPEAIDFLFWDLSQVKNPPPEWTEIVLAFVQENWMTLNHEVLRGCMDFLTTVDIPAEVEEELVGSLLAREPTPMTVLGAIGSWHRVSGEAKDRLACKIMETYQSMPLRQRALTWLIPAFPIFAVKRKLGK